MKTTELSVIPSNRISIEHVIVDFVHHDSGEHPEAACVNHMVSTRVGDCFYHQPGDDWKAAVQWAKNKFAHGLPVPPFRRNITVVFTRYAKSFELDWDSVVSPLMKARNMGLLDPTPLLGAEMVV
ncbi:hypothetical protein [Ralstonia pseudosolanacearum]|uniref:hypothetical protein n=1 Tax=Ralstonia pseudosolanacearum TaxID=1310165 RepID=UPI003CF1B7D2